MKDLSREAFSEKYKNDTAIIIIVPKNGSSEKIMVYLIEDDKSISNKTVESIATKMKENNIKDGIIMSNAT